MFSESIVDNKPRTVLINAGGLAVQGSNVPLAVDSVQHVFLNYL